MPLPKKIFVSDLWCIRLYFEVIPRSDVKIVRSYLYKGATLVDNRAYEPYTLADPQFRDWY